MWLTPEEFEAAVEDAMDQIPAALAARIENLAVLIDERSPDGNLFGLYEGVPLTARGTGWAGFLPDRITVFREPMTSLAPSREALVEQIRITVIHEVGHYFGIDDARLHELGWA